MTSVNLLSPSYVAKRNLRQVFRQWSLAVAVGMIGVGLWVAYEYFAMLQSKHQLAYVQAEHAKQKLTKAEIKKLTERRNLLAEREQETFELDDDVPLLDLLGIVGKASAASDGKIHVERFRFAKSRSSRSAEGHTLQLNGVAENTVAIARFAAAIRDAEVFDAVELASTGIAKTDFGKQYRTFDIECSLHMEEVSVSDLRSARRGDIQ